METDSGERELAETTSSKVSESTFVLKLIENRTKLQFFMSLINVATLIPLSEVIETIGSPVG